MGVAMLKVKEFALHETEETEEMETEHNKTEERKTEQNRTEQRKPELNASSNKQGFLLEKEEREREGVDFVAFP